MQLTQKQEEAFQAIKSGKNVCITGSAGTGKSEVIKLFRNLYQKQRVVITTSTTGISALLIGGTTLHSYLGLGLGTSSAGALITKIHKKAYLRQRWKTLQTLIIDEISMLSPTLFDKLESIARAIRKDERPFGGIQLVLSGDFLQLPVVGEDKFCFEANSWDKCIDTVIYLKDIIRQDDRKFKECLSEVRMGKLSRESKNLLKSCKNKKLENNLGIKPTKLYSTNAEVDEKNEEELDILAQDNRTFVQYDMEYDVYTNDRYINVQKYCKDCTAPESIQLCAGAQVMLVWNLDIDNGLVNGSRGVVTGFVEEMPRVQFLNGEARIIDYNIWEVMDKDTKLMSITQVPLKLAWNCTFHKVQGATLDYAIVDMNNIFTYGQAYVALSRVKSIDGLSIEGLHFKKIRSHPKAIEFYKKLEEQEDHNMCENISEEN